MLRFRLGDAIRVKHGYAFPGAQFSEDPAYPTLVTPANFALGGGFQAARPKTFRGEVPEEFLLAAGSLIITMTDLSKAGDTLGLPGVVPKHGSYLHNQRIGLVELRGRSLLDLSFLGYFLRTQGYREHILGTASGSTVRHTSPSRIEGFVAQVPPLREQRAIAEVLGALDNKIAANERSIRCAGEVADAEFARFRQVAKTIQRTFAEVAEVGGGGTPRTSVAEYWGESIPWATPTDVTGLAAPYLHQTSRSITDEGLAACSSSLYPIGSILMTSRATIGAFAIAQVPVAVNQGFIVVNAKDPELQWWIYHDMRSRVDEFLAHSNGATFLELPRGKFKQLPVQAPGLDAALRFSEVVGPLHGVATARLVENARLAATRDELLPLLMSGRLHVKDAEKVVAEVV